MKAFLVIGIGLCALCVGCDGGVSVDVTTPGKSCEIHNIPLEKGVVPIRYGLFRWTTEEVEAHQKLFPHAHSSYHKGCEVERASRARVSFCPECRKAEAIWKETQRQKMALIQAP